MAGATTAAPELFPDADGLVGSIAIWLSDTLPGPKWDWADGGELNREQHSLLFSRIGEDWGDGDGTTTFNKPDLEDRFLVGKGSDADFDVLGGTGGAKSGSVSAHTHSTPNHSHGAGTYAAAVANTQVATTGGLNVASSQSAAVSGNSATDGSGTTGSGGGGTVATVPPFATVHFILKVS